MTASASGIAQSVEWRIETALALPVSGGLMRGAQQVELSLVVAAVIAVTSFASVAQTSSGTGFAVAPGVLVTNQHVVADCTSIEVVSSDGRRNASITIDDEDVDLAVLRVIGLKGPTARLRKAHQIRLGETVFVFGYPYAGTLSSEGNFTSGVVSALRGVRDAAGELQITAPVQPGNSGGPLIDASGLVIGVVQAKLDALRVMRATGDVPQNVNFAISLDVLTDFLNKNRVPYQYGSRAGSMSTDELARTAQAFSHRIECRTEPSRASTPARTIPTPLAVLPRDGKQGLSGWMATRERCYVWNAVPQFNESVSWSGGCVNGLAQGTGTLQWFTDGKLAQVYEGGVKEGKLNGQGTNTFPSGESYAGGYKDGLPHGSGTFTGTDGRKYIGELNSGLRHGLGTLYAANGSVMQAGKWENGKFISGQDQTASIPVGVNSCLEALSEPRLRTACATGDGCKGQMFAIERFCVRAPEFSCGQARSEIATQCGSYSSQASCSKAILKIQYACWKY